MKEFKVAELTDFEKDMVETFEKSLGLVLIAYKPEDDSEAKAVIK